MNNILRLTTANIRANKSQTISLLIFVLIAALLLNTGLVLFTGIGSFFDERAEFNNASHFTAAYEHGAAAIDEGYRFMQGHPDVIEVEKLDVLGSWGNFSINDIEGSTNSILSRVESAQTMGFPTMIGEYLPLTGTGIYIPYFMFLSADSKLGDEFKLEISGIEFSFTVSGATEEINFGSQMNTLHRFYIPDSRFSELENQLTSENVFLGNMTILSARLQNAENAVFFYADYNKEVSAEGFIFSTSINFAKQGRTFIPMIVAVIVTVFALMLLIVSMIVIRFRIINSIEEGMVNIGTQKAVGYRSIQIIASIVLQFGLTALIGSAMGILLSQLLIPVISDIIRPMLALIWVPSFDIVIAALSMGTVIFVVTLISFITARRINKLHPLIALRGGIMTHSFRKNALPLEISRAPLGVALALKNLMQNKKQAVTVAVIIALVTFASITGVAANHSMNAGREEFARSMFGEMPDASFQIISGENGDAFKERLKSRPEVRKVFGYSLLGSHVIIDETSIFMAMVEDSSLLEGRALLSGRYPVHENEIALGAAFSKVSGIGIGDTVLIRLDDAKKDYLITGIIQYVNFNGFNGLITGDGFRQLQPDYVIEEFNVYLYDNIDIDEFIETVQATENNILLSAFNLHTLLSAQLSGMGGVFAAVAVGILAVTIFVVFLTLYMVIKTIILRRRQELGIQKAVGFTTLQLMNQIAINLTPVIIIGVVTGAITGYFGFNPIMIASTRGMGIVQLSLPIILEQVIIVSFALVALAYAVSMLISLRIRKISAYTLVRE